MGQNLSEAYGDDYVSVGFSTCEGTFIALNQEIDRLGSLVLPSPLADSYESVFCTVGIPSFLLDLRKLESGSLVSDWMNTSRPFKLIGSVPDLANGEVTSANGYDVSLPMHYDLLIHITNTHALELDL
jgi:erythromycin esterase-like protein